MLLLGLMFATTTAYSQDTGAIAVLDVAKVFKAHTKFNQQLEAIQAQAQKLKSEVDTSQQELRQQAQRVSETLNVGSRERKEAEADLEQKMTSLRTYARQSEAELMSQEAKIYYDTYLQMQKIVTEAAQANNISLVLRFDSSETNTQERASVVSLVNRTIVFQTNSDITDYVIGQMNAVPTQASNPASPQLK
jgi:Skp family chaperone for outer membrane proteins